MIFEQEFAEEAERLNDFSLRSLLPPVQFLLIEEI